jgi:hypothetical protein
MLDAAIRLEIVNYLWPNYPLLEGKGILCGLVVHSFNAIIFILTHFTSKTGINTRCPSFLNADL